MLIDELLSGKGYRVNDVRLKVPRRLYGRARLWLIIHRSAREMFDTDGLYIGLQVT